MEDLAGRLGVRSGSDKFNYKYLRQTADAEMLQQWRVRNSIKSSRKKVALYDINRKKFYFYLGF